MKVTCFYLVDEELSSSKYVAVEPEKIIDLGNTFAYFYAFTPSKKVCKEFTSKRDMKLFITKEIEMSREDYEVFCDNNDDLILEYHSFMTEGFSRDKSKYKKTDTVILCTSKESSIILYRGKNIFCDFIDTECDILLADYEVVELFNNTIQEILVEYFYMESFMYCVFPIDEDCDYEYDINGAMMFWRLFSNTFKHHKKGGYDLNEIVEIFQKRR